MFSLPRSSLGPFLQYIRTEIGSQISSNVFRTAPSCLSTGFPARGIASLAAGAVHRPLTSFRANVRPQTNSRPSHSKPYSLPPSPILPSPLPILSLESLRPNPALRSRHILFLTNSHNSMSQRAYLELTKMGHRVTVELALSEDGMKRSVNELKPDLIICPFLTKAVPAEIWQTIPTLIVHPGIKGDRGMSSLDWTITQNLPEWGVTVLEACETMDAGPIWATRNFKIDRSGVTKSSLYKNEVIDAAMECLKEAVFKFEHGIAPEALDYSRADVRGILQPRMNQIDRKIDWADSAEDIARRIRAADGSPGVLDEFGGVEVFLFGAHVEPHPEMLPPTSSSGSAPKPKTILAHRDGAVCVACGDRTALWLTHMKRKGAKNIKLPSTMVLPAALLAGVPLQTQPSPGAWRDVWLETRDRVGYLHFDMHNGAMSTAQCQRLNAAVQAAGARPDIDAVVMMGGYDYFSNGIHLNMIEASPDPAAESWNNINAINDVVLSMMNIKDKMTVSAMGGNAGAGGVMMALAADQVYTHAGVVLNPHYRTMGLNGSEYWTHNLVRRAGKDTAQMLTESVQPIGADAALSYGLVDHVLARNVSEFRSNLHEMMTHNVKEGLWRNPVLRKQKERDEQWAAQMASHRAHELNIMRDNFRDPVYHTARQNFVYKKAAERTPGHFPRFSSLARLMDGRAAAQAKYAELAKEVAQLRKQYPSMPAPGLGLVMVGSRKDSETYVKIKRQRAAEIGVREVFVHLPENQPNLEEELIRSIEKLNEDPSVHGILVQFPLPPNINVTRVVSAIRKEKDVDGLHPAHVGEFTFTGSCPFVPCAALSALELLRLHDVKVTGKNAVVVGASNVVGLPVALALLRQHATVQIAHRHTQNLEQLVRSADVLVTGVGVPHLIPGEWVKPHAVVVDAGISHHNGAVVGDVDFEGARARASLITPVPGGVGPMTVAMLLHNMVMAYRTHVQSQAAAQRVNQEANTQERREQETPASPAKPSMPIINPLAGVTSA